jgi:hypothetical protein
MAGSFKSLLWSNIVAAFAGSSTEALGAAMVNVSCLVSLDEVVHIGFGADHVL